MFIDLKIISALVFLQRFGEKFMSCAERSFLLSVVDQHQGRDRVKFLATSGPND